MSTIDYKTFLDKFKTVFDEDRICKIFLINNFFADAIGEEDELLYYASAYLYLYVKSVDDAADKKTYKAFDRLFFCLDYQKKSWEHFVRYCNKSDFAPYWDEYVALTATALRKRLRKENTSISELWEMSSFICLIPIALCIKHKKIKDIPIWRNFVSNLFCAIQIIDDMLDLIEDSRDGVFNIFENLLSQRKGKTSYITIFHKVEAELIDRAVTYLINAVNIAESLSANKWVAYCNEWINQLMKQSQY